MSFYTGWPLCGRFFLTKFTSVKGSLDTKAEVLLFRFYGFSVRIADINV